MKNEIPDFSSWQETERSISMLSDKTVFLEVRAYKGKMEGGKSQTGRIVYIFGKEVLRAWSIFISDEEVLLKALKTEEGKWEMGIPVLKEISDEFKRAEVMVSVHIKNEQNPFIKIVMFKPDGAAIERTIFKNDDPPKK